VYVPRIDEQAVLEPGVNGQRDRGVRIEVDLCTEQGRECPDR
jgi:hypothetical protein